MNNWGFLGTGRVTQRMTEAVHKARGATIYGIASREIDRAKAWAANAFENPMQEEHEVVYPFANYGALLESPSIDWVYVALPPSLHHQWTIAALAAGKNVLCEKPLCLNAQQAFEVADAAYRYDRKLFHATAFPYHPRSLAARSMIRSGELGDIRRIHVACSFAGILTRGNDHRTESDLGGGCLLDLGWYCVLSTLWFTGLDCVRLHAIGSKWHGVWDQVQVLAELNNGAIAHWDCGFDAAPRRWIEIAGRQASWICDDFMRPTDVTKPRFWIHGFDGKSKTEMVGEGTFQESAMIEACQTSTLPSKSDRNQSTLDTGLVTDQLEVALKTHRILDCIEQSAELGIAIDV